VTALDIPGFVDAYGYLAVFAGAFLEGETILALAGLAARRGYLDLRAVIAIAIVAGFAGDQFFFFLGRHHGQRILERFPAVRSRALGFDALLARWHAPLIVAIRFMYGLRIVGPIVLGMGRVAAWKFVVFNLIGAVLWAPIIVGVGYAFGALVESMLDDVNRYELGLFATLVAMGGIGALYHRLRARRLRDVGAHRAPPGP
jgi:membrane protein DedA with SNARE-associated domain